ncbi:MAG: efflux RND transporter permease subunit [Acidobacteriota bacterium]|nr:MAG: efflux RND transporter permease subunit [Acidobacteriota bacterium]
MNLIKTAIQRPVTVSMFVVAVILFGLVSLDRLALNLLPDISYPSLTIQTDYEDAAPEEIETLITQQIEEAVGVVPGLTKMTSVSRSGQSEIVMEFGWDTDMDIASLEVREKLDFISIPRDAEKPVILRFDPSYDPILRIRIYGDSSLSSLRYLAEKELKKYLESTAGVAAIKVIGGLEEQIRIEVDEKRLAELGIPITEVTEVLRQENLNQATGSLYDQDANYLVRMLNQFRSVEEIRGITVREQEGRRVVLGDVARVWRGSKDREIIARLEGKESVEMAVYKEGDANTVTVARLVISQLEFLKNKDRFPEGVDYEIVSNQATFIENSVDNVLSAAIIGGILATLILFIFLRDLRSTLTIGFSIPISIMATFALMYQTEITLNIMSLGGVALGVGMLVDNSIVVLEAIDRYRKSGTRLAQAVYQGTREVSRAVTASTLTTVAVFLPLIFVEGIAGQLFRDQALTITYALLASLLVAMAVIPMALARTAKEGSPPEETTGTTTTDLSQVGRFRRGFRKVRSWATQILSFLFIEMSRVVLTDLRRLLRLFGRAILVVISPLLNAFDRGFNWLSLLYPKGLAWALNNKSLVFALALALAAGSGWTAQKLGAELIPPLTQGEFSFEIKLPEGRPLAQTDQTLARVEETVEGYPEVETVYSSIGGSTENQFARNTLQENVGQLYVVMSDKRDTIAEEKVIAQIRNELSEIPDITYKFQRPTLFSFRTPVEVEVYSYNLTNLRTVSEQVAGLLAEIPGLSDIKTSTRAGDPEIHVTFDRAKLARLGLEESQISAALRNKIRGDVATRYREEEKQIDILVRVEEADRKTVTDLRNMAINIPVTNPGQRAASQSAAEQTSEEGSVASDTIPIRLGAVADIRVDRGPSEIRRIRSRRAALISANLSGRDLNSVAQEINAQLATIAAQIPPNTTVSLAGQREELDASYRSLVFAFALAVFLVYLVMASQFESLIHPFIIIFCVPLAVIGVVFSLALTGTTISVMVFLGVIILAGIVVNNAIVLIDYTNQLRGEGYSKRDALLLAGQVRLRPIVMTTLTTVLGLIPMALGWGEGAEVRAPMAITVMGGLMFSTLLTLVFIPVVYELVDRKAFVGEPLLDDDEEATPGHSVADGLTPFIGGSTNA